MHDIRIKDSASKFCIIPNEALPAQQFYSKALFETNADAIVVTDPQGIIKDVNRQMVKLTGYGRSELIGTSWFCFCPNVVAAGAAFAQALTDDRVCDTELVVAGRNGTRTAVSYNAAPVYDSETNLVGVFATLRDVTEYHQLRREIDAQKLEVAKASQMKSDFLATMSHELRTPLTPIIGFSEALLSGMLGTIADQQKEYVQDIYDSGLHLMRLINDILDLSKINAGMAQLNLETSDLAALIKNSVSKYTGEGSAASSINFHVDCGDAPLDLQLDVHKAEKMIDHMLSNAVKFSPTGGTIQIALRKVPRDRVGHLKHAGAVHGFPLPSGNCREFLQLSIEDKGLGIAPENLRSIYDLFTQVDSGLDRRHEGVGLGLSMVQSLAMLHGGTSAIASREGKGTKIAVWFPIRLVPVEVTASHFWTH